MPYIVVARCSFCLNEIYLGPVWWQYAIDNEGRRIVLSHPGEAFQVPSVIGHEPSPEELRQRTGSEWAVYCNDCGFVFGHDREKDKKVCPVCGSAEVLAVTENDRMRCQNCPGAKIDLEVLMIT